MIVCQNCGTKNNDNFNCCYNCGTPLPKKTPTLTSENNKKPKIMPLVYSIDDEDNEDDIQNNKEETELTEDAPVFESDSFDDIDEENYSENENLDLDDDNEETASYYSAAYEDEKSNTIIAKKHKSQTKQSAKNPKYEINLSKLIPALALVFVALIVIWGTGKLLDNIFESTPGSSPTPPVYSQLESDFNTSALVYSDFDSSGNKVFTVNINTEGETVMILNQTYNVVDGIVSVAVTEFDIYRNYRPSGIQSGQTFDTKMPVTISKSGYKDYKYNVEVQGVSTPSVPYTLLSPSAEKTDIYSTATTISFQTEKDCSIYINGTDYTDEYFDRSTGIFSITINTPISDNPYRFNVRIESADYMTREIELEFIRTQSWDPNAKPEIKVDKAVWETNEDCTVTITGTFKGNPEDLSFVERYSSSSAVELISLTVSDDGSGRFEAVVKSNKLGWADVSVECKTNLDYTDSIYIKCLSNSLGGYTKFTTSSKDVLDNYDAIKGNSYKGDKFVTYGSHYAVIKSVEKTELGCAFYATLNNGTEEQLIYVETCTETFTFEAGRAVTVFGNLCGNKDGVPRIIAVSVTAK